MATKFEGKKILIVEDDNFLSEMLGKKFSEEKAIISRAPDGEVALSLLKANKFDLVLLDLMLPKVGGFEVLSAMNEDGSIKTTPVIVLSNLGQKVDVDKGMKLGAKKFLVKAILSLDEIVTASAEIIK